MKFLRTAFSHRTPQVAASDDHLVIINNEKAFNSLDHGFIIFFQMGKYHVLLIEV